MFYIESDFIYKNFRCLEFCEKECKKIVDQLIN